MMAGVIWVMAVEAGCAVLWVTAAWVVHVLTGRIDQRTPGRWERVLCHLHCFLIQEPLRFLSHERGHVSGIRREFRPWSCDRFP